MFYFTPFSNVQIFISIIIFYKVLERALELIESPHVASLICVFDQTLCSKACEIKWKEPAAKFKSCLLMMGMFHLIIAYMSIFNKHLAVLG